jgi:cupin superfamily acireductone dioxygenase involved in methionine salvage
MTIVTMMERKECVEIDQAQLFQQFNLQADRDRHDLIFDVVEDIARILGRAETQYLKTDYDSLRDSLDSVVTLAQKFGFGHLSRVAQDVKFCVDGNDLVAVSSTFQWLLRVGEQSLFAIWDMPIYS